MVSIDALRLMHVHTFASGYQVVLVIVHDGREAKMGDRTRVTVTGQRNDLERIYQDDQLAVTARLRAMRGRATRGHSVNTDVSARITLQVEVTVVPVR